MSGSEHDVRRSELRMDVWRTDDAVARRRVREQVRRPLAVNLAEGLALSKFLATFRGAAKQ